MDINNSSDDDEGVMINKKTSFKKLRKSTVEEDIEQISDAPTQRSKKTTARVKPRRKSNGNEKRPVSNHLHFTDSSSEDTDLLYRDGTLVTCRNASNSFYLCQLLEDVHPHTKKLRIRWCSVLGENGDDTKISIKTKFKLDYADHLNPNTILMDILDPIEHPDDTISLKKQHIVDTKRLLEKSIRGESLSSDDMMDLSTEHQRPAKKSSVPSHKHFPSSSDSDTSASSQSTVLVAPKSNKRKKTVRSKTSRKQPAKRQRRTKVSAEVSEKKIKPKKQPVVRKAQLFKVQSNRLLEGNLTVTKYVKEPFFEDNLTVPFISSYVQSKLAIRAVLIDDSKLLKSLINDVNRVCSVHVARSLHNDLSAIHYAIKHNNIPILQILIDDCKSPKKNRCPFPNVSEKHHDTGRASIYTLGFRTAPIMASRGAKEGNNALTKDNMEPMYIDQDDEIISYALKNNCSREAFDLLVKKLIDPTEQAYDSLHVAIQAGHRKLAASIIGDIKDNTFHGFNYLHHQVLLYDNEDLTINRAASVIKKTRANFAITPIHCAAINPNVKYLKQLLSAMPEYSILDKYERRPIHFAAACEGPEPLEYLLSKLGNFNDVDRAGNSPLHIAVMSGRAANAEILLRAAKEKAESNEAEDQTIYEKFGLASINRMNKSRCYPLHLAVLNNHLDCTKVLLEYGASVDISNSPASEKLTPLMLACQKGFLDIVTCLIENGAKVEARDRFKRTPLIHACMCGNADIVSYLLRLGANANVFDSSFNTALHYAIAYGWYFCVKLLLEAGANLNCVNSWQTTCLGAGFLKGHYGLCDYLLTDHHVDINFKTDDGLTLVMLTVGLEISSAVVKQLEYVVTKHKADCTAVDANGSNAFHYLAANLSVRETHLADEDTKKTFHDNYIQMAKMLLDNHCNPNQMNHKTQSPLMIALETGNFLLVNYLINQAKIEITADVSSNGKTILHYFAQQCDQHDLIQTLFKLPVNDETKKMGQIIDSNGRTPLHYSASKFTEFCQQNKDKSSAMQSTNEMDELKKKYRSIVQMIEYCLESAECDPDVQMKATEQLKENDQEEEENKSSEDGESDEDQDENPSPASKNKSDSKLEETSIFSLLLTVPFIDPTDKHPLEIHLRKTKNPNVLHHQTHRTPLLESIHLQQTQTTHILINHPLCDINLPNEHHQTPLIFACKSQLLPVIRSLLEHRQCQITSTDDDHNQAIHYYLRASNRSNEYVEILNILIKKLKSINENALNIPGKQQRTPLHIAVYHNLGTIDAMIEIEKILIENGSDLFSKDDLGNLPLHNVFLSKKISDDPVELCVLILKSMKYQSIDTKNHQGDTPLHLAVAKCSTVCVMFLQQHHANLLLENNRSNSIIGTCIASGHLNLFITFIQQSIEINLGKLHRLSQIDLLPRKTKKVTWIWKYVKNQSLNDVEEYSLIYLIIRSDWQGALSLILNELDRFHLNYIEILEGAIVNNKLNLVLRLLFRLKDEFHFQESNSHQQNLYHLLANINQYDENLLKQILLFLSDYKFSWNTSDEYGCYPLHYACVKQNFVFIQFLREKYPTAVNLTQTDRFGNTPIGLLFWSVGSRSSLANDKLRLIISSEIYLNCLCNYDNAVARDPLAFNAEKREEIPYPPMKSDGLRTSPLIQAIVHNNFPLVQFLLELKADVNFPDEKQQTPLLYAVQQNNIDIVKLLLNKNHSLEANPTNNNQQSNRGRRQRFFLGASSTTDTDKSSSNPNSSKTFPVTSQINLGAIDTDGRTCIHHLIQPFPHGTYTNNLDLLRLLHSSGATLTTTDHSGLTPLECSNQCNYQHLSNELRKLINNKKSSMKKLIFEHFPIDDPNKHLLIQPDFYSDAEQVINDYLVSHPISKSNPVYQADRTSGMSSTGEVLIDSEKNKPYDVRLAKTDINYGVYGLYTFYRMQIIKHKSKANLYFLFTRWGRIGFQEGQHQLTPYSTLDECRKEFIKIFKEKTGNLWNQTEQFEAKPKKYSLVRLNESELKKYPHVPIDFRRLQDENEHPPSKLQSTVYKTLLGTFINQQAVRKDMHHIHLDVESMPASQLQRQTLEKAREILDKIKNLIEKKEKLNENDSGGKHSNLKNDIKSILESIHQYSNEYYTLIPMNSYSDEKLRVLDENEHLKRQEKILEDLFQLELSYKILLGAQGNLKQISPLDYIYKSINCEIQALDEDQFDSQLILRYIWSTAPNVQIEQIFKVARAGEDERIRNCGIDNRYLLWHGTDICNLISILSRGLLVGTVTASASGSLFGTGIYTADTFVKSLGYCSGVKEKDSERYFMLLCEVALGDVKEVGVQRVIENEEEEEEEQEEEEEEDDDDLDKPLDLKKFQSRKGLGQRIPNPKHTITLSSGVQVPLGELIDNDRRSYNLYNNEYIVYDEAQVAIRYLVQFRLS